MAMLTNFEVYASGSNPWWLTNCFNRKVYKRKTGYFVRYQGAFYPLNNGKIYI